MEVFESTATMKLKNAMMHLRPVDVCLLMAVVLTLEATWFSRERLIFFQAVKNTVISNGRTRMGSSSDGEMILYCGHAREEKEGVET